jgi:hypothetical protein
MNVVQYVLGILAALFTLTVVVEMLRRRRLRERHAMWWLVAGLLALLIAVFPNLLEGFSAWLGFSVPVNLVFFVSLFILFLVALQHSWELTKLEDHNRKLVERIVILELRTEKLEAKKPAGKPSRTRAGR